MNYKMKRVLFAALAAFLLSACHGGRHEALPDSEELPVVREQFLTECPVTGSGITEEYSEVQIYQDIQDMGRKEPAAAFSVEGGSFAGSVRLDSTLVYQLVFSVPGSGMAQVRPFVPTATGVSVVGPESIGGSIQLVSDTPENACMRDFENVLLALQPVSAPIFQRYSRLMGEKALYSQAVYALLAEADTASRERSLEIYSEFNEKLRQRDDSYSRAGLSVKKELDAFQAMSDSIVRSYLAEHPTVSSFYRICEHLEQARQTGKELKPWSELYERCYAQRFPGHPYHTMILAMTGNRVGDPIRDFTLPDAKGKLHTLSELVGGKVAVVDFWASWCGSCRIRSKALIPIYEKYADDDFTIVGVALEYRNDTAWRKALDRDGYPWTNLLALDASPALKANHATVFLLDPDGIILTINPSVEELDRLLQNVLGR